MLKFNFTCGLVLSLTAALVVATSDAALAKKKHKLTYEEAWAHCTKEISHIPRQNAGQRQAAGGACMHRYGYRL